MAKPTKRKVQGGRVTPKGTRPDDYRGAATGPVSTAKAMGPSPMWVPVLMFTLFAVGMIIIFLNYTGLLPSAPSNWWLLGGLGAILGGIITSTQYR
ncbi:MAG: cell division protein CrgA [Acidimicrobiia bacterium]|nr:cell division protein CrgA [Acidimicrobiia bacterium]MDH5237264.1 cell division protein CrgA [Acidimicrobiia bacterium]